MGREMGRKLQHLGRATLLIGGALLGCHKSAIQHKEPPDPLLVTKPPVEGRPHTAKSSPLTGNEPTPPMPPSGDSPTSVRHDGAAPVRPAHLLSPITP